MTRSAAEEATGIEDCSTPGGGVTSLQRAPRSRALRDSLYDEIRVAGWAAALLATPPFQRLAGVSLSDVPGELLFGRPFPSRLDHALGVYHRGAGQGLRPARSRPLGAPTTEASPLPRFAGCCG